MLDYIREMLQIADTEQQYRVTTLARIDSSLLIKELHRRLAAGYRSAELKSAVVCEDGSRSFLVNTATHKLKYRYLTRGLLRVDVEPV
jgi:hypothetical protein